MKGQLSLFEPEFIRDCDCGKDTPVIHIRKKPVRKRKPLRRSLSQRLLPLLDCVKNLQIGWY